MQVTPETEPFSILSAPKAACVIRTVASAIGGRALHRLAPVLWCSHRLPPPAESHAQIMVRCNVVGSVRCMQRPVQCKEISRGGACNSLGAAHLRYVFVHGLGCRTWQPSPIQPAPTRAALSHAALEHGRAPLQPRRVLSVLHAWLQMLCTCRTVAQASVRIAVAPAAAAKGACLAAFSGGLLARNKGQPQCCLAPGP
jgi:hypothetical protein